METGQRMEPRRPERVFLREGSPNTAPCRFQEINYVSEHIFNDLNLPNLTHLTSFLHLSLWH